MRAFERRNPGPRLEDQTRLDFLYLLDQLEEVLTSGSRVPLTNRTMVDEQEILDILDQIRVAVPEEIKQARKVSQDRDRILADARAEAEQIRRSADDDVASLISNHALVEAAEDRAEQIEEHARREVEQMRREADDYAYRLLTRMRAQVARVSEAVDRSLDEFDSPDAGSDS